MTSPATPSEADLARDLAGRRDEKSLRSLIVALAAEYTGRHHKPGTFVPGTSAVPVSGKVFGAPEMKSLVEASLDFWLTTGRFNDAFEARLAKFIGVGFARTTNSGSSANLLALSSLTSPLLRDRALKPGDEVITAATGFPTTVNPTLQYGLVPVFVDSDIPTYNIRAELIEAAVSGKTRAIMIAHTLGNPFDLDEVMRVAKKHDLWVIEDCCDALGATYDGQMVGTFGNIGTLSFYPAHHITMGEGGAIFTDRMLLNRAIESMRDWGRDCWCAPGKDNTCGKRFARKSGDLPRGYDHKYTYSHCGYNLKITDMQAAVGLAQLDRLEDFIAARRRNFSFLSEALKPLEDILILPQATLKSDPSWFGFAITLRPGCGIERADLIAELESKRIGTRLLFGGNLVRQPYMRGRNYRVAGELHNADIITEHTFWIGLYPGLTSEHLAYVSDTICKFVRGARRPRVGEAGAVASPGRERAPT